MGAYLNVLINTKDLEDKGAVQDYVTRGLAIQEQAIMLEGEILAAVSENM